MPFSCAVVVVPVKFPVLKVMPPPLLVTTGAWPVIALPATLSGPVMVMTLLDTVAPKSVTSFALIWLATFSATVLVLLLPIDESFMISTPFTVMLSTSVVPVPPTVMVAL